MRTPVAGGESAVLVHIDFRNPQFNEEFDEFIQLASSSGLSILTTITGTRAIPNAKYFAGTGKVEEIRRAVADMTADVVVFNHALTPGQERNLESAIGCRVIDRVGLILDIFAQRARSYEGMLQVELAQLQHLSTRLVRGWTHLERQKGGIGLRGPGETQLETDRRLLGNRIRTISSRLEKVRRQRNQVRRWRQRSATPIISLVGYTNAGKSTLFNRLTGAHSYVADKLFATLDTTLRKVIIEPGHQVVLSDTVGFIRHIPHDLIEAFHATLEEVKESDLLLHVIDVNDAQRYSHIEQVNGVIRDIGAESLPQILVFNKIDLKSEIAARVEKNNGSMPQVWLSAATGVGVDGLLQVISQHLEPTRRLRILHIPTSASRLRADLFRSGEVCEEHLDQDGSWVMHINISVSSLQRLCRDYGIDEAAIQ
ncbi:MAG: GTPase HflX [Gammaproteobacteria bacterium RIFCSPLOWO2_12_FULL_52_10]|nr:MAG: GTPase HflX [Gammaproteobacteria bacterium RIFCSPLOWO2_12_FULL_52_10]